MAENNELFDFIEEIELKPDIKNLTPFLTLPEFYDEEDEYKFYEKVANFIRHSIEYKNWIKLLREELNLTKCLFTEESRDKGVKIDLHHHPFTLSDIVKVVTRKIMRENSNKKDITSFIIADEVIRLHYEMKVGIVPLTSDLHHKFHTTQFPIPCEFIIGDWKAIVKEPYVPDQQLIKKAMMQEAVTLDNYEFTTVKWPTY